MFHAVAQAEEVSWASIGLCVRIRKCESRYIELWQYKSNDSFKKWQWKLRVQKMMDKSPMLKKSYMAS